MINITPETITNWELNRNIPNTSYIPRIISFLEYSPIFHQNPVVNYRVQNGLTQKELSKIFKIAPSTLLKIEKRRSKRMSEEVKIGVDLIIILLFISSYQYNKQYKTLVFHPLSIRP